MEEVATNDHQSSTPGNTVRSSSKLLRFPLRSAAATKSKEDKTPVADSTNSSASKRRRPPSSVSKSVGILDLSDKGKPVKPVSRRLSIPTKSTSSPAPKPVGNVTPITDTKAKRSASTRLKSSTPNSDVTKSSNRKKFTVLSSASYWISQIKLSEAAAKHSISLGFFKLALDAGCEPFQQMKEELKSYARRHNLIELGELAKELFESYKIAECFEQMQVSQTVSHVVEEGTQSSDDGVHSSSSVTGSLKLRPEPMKTGSSSANKGSAKEVTKKNKTAPRTHASASRTSANPKFASAAAAHEAHKKSLRPNKKHYIVQKNKVKKPEKESVPEEVITSSPAAEETTKENKENVDAPQMEEINLTEA